MDNNFNQQAPQQPVYQQAPQQMPQQQMYQQPMYQQPMYQPAPKKPSNVNATEFWGLILSVVGALMAVIGSIVTCSCSASTSWKYERFEEFAKDGSGKAADFNLHKMSLLVIIAIIGTIMAIVGVVLAILALKQKNAAVKAGKLAYIAIAVGTFGVFYGILPMLTICGYNCALDSKSEYIKELIF